MRAVRPIDDFVLTDHDGEAWSLRRQLAAGRAALLTFRGTWCPFSLRTWRGLSSLTEEVAATGVPLLGISADDPWTLAGFRIRLDLPYRLLSDPQLVAARRLGVACGRRHPRARTYPAGAFLQSGFFVLDSDGTVLHAWVPDSREVDSLAGGDRPGPREIVAALRLHAVPGGAPAARVAR